MSTPQSKINICSGVRLKSDRKNTIYFSSSEKQLTYFAGKVVKTLSAYSYLRKNWSIKVETTIDQAEKWSYLYFQNGTSGKYYFYFITNAEYINDNTVELFLELDEMQTYLFDITLLPSFIERQHVTSDTIGEHTLDENLELGELITTSSNDISLQDMCVLIMATYDPITTQEEFTDTVLAAKYNNVFSGLGIYATNISDWQALGMKLKLLDDYGKSDGIISMWMYPKELVTLASDESWTDGKVTHKVTGVSNINYEHSGRVGNLNGYTPKNNKMFCYPYNFLYVDNNCGGSAVYRYERFGDPSRPNFRVCGALSPDGSVKCYPLNYNGEQHAFEYGLGMSGFPTCAWNQDVYKLWLAQNQNQHNQLLHTSGASIVAGAVTTIGGLATGNLLVAGAGAGMVVSGGTTIENLLAQKKDMSIQPPQAKGSHSTSVNVANGFQNFTIKRKCITKENARIIDNFLDMYGYKINCRLTPNIHARESWTYIKTIDCNVVGELGNDDLAKIRTIFDNGVTFWVNGDKIGDYTQSNNTL